MVPIEAAFAAIESREPGEHFLYSQIAKHYGTVCTTLMRRHQHVAQAHVTTDSTLRNLNSQQEVELLRYITRLMYRGLPPTRQMIQSFVYQSPKSRSHYRGLIALSSATLKP